MYCTQCKINVKEKMYETGLESYCNCQTTIDADFDSTKWMIQTKNKMRVCLGIISDDINMFYKALENVKKVMESDRLRSEGLLTTYKCQELDGFEYEYNIYPHHPEGTECDCNPKCR